MRYKITANAPVNCFGYGLQFSEGVAWTDDQEIAEYLKSKAYKVEKVREKKTVKSNE